MNSRYGTAEKRSGLTRCLTVPAAFLIFLSMSPTRLHAEKLELPKRVTGDEVNQGPVMKYEGADDGADVSALALQGEVVLAARIDSVMQGSAGLIPVPSNRARVRLRDIEVLKGPDPRRDVFLYSGNARELKPVRAAKYLVVLNRSKAGDLEISAMTVLTKSRRGVVDTALGRSPERFTSSAHSEAG